MLLQTPRSRQTLVSNISEIFLGNSVDFEKFQTFKDVKIYKLQKSKLDRSSFDRAHRSAQPNFRKDEEERQTQSRTIIISARILAHPLASLSRDRQFLLRRLAKLRALFRKIALLSPYSISASCFERAALERRPPPPSYFSSPIFLLLLLFLFSFLLSADARRRNDFSGLCVSMTMVQNSARD